MRKRTTEKAAPAPEARREPAQPATVIMVRDAALSQGGPTEAHVHPSQVEEWQAAGWHIREEKEKGT